MQKISPSSFELPGVSATEVERERDRDGEETEAAREETGVPEDLGLAAEFCFLSFEFGKGLS